MKLPPGPVRRRLSTPRRSSSTWMPALEIAGHGVPGRVDDHHLGRHADGVVGRAEAADHVRARVGRGQHEERTLGAVLLVVAVGHRAAARRTDRNVVRLAQLHPGQRPQQRVERVVHVVHVPHVADRGAHAAHVRVAAAYHLRQRRQPDDFDIALQHRSGHAVGAGHPGDRAGRGQHRQVVGARGEEELHVERGDRQRREHAHGHAAPAGPGSGHPCRPGCGPRSANPRDAPRSSRRCRCACSGRARAPRTRAGSKSAPARRSRGSPSG